MPLVRQDGPSWVDLEPSGHPFWEPFWDQIGPRGAKMGPRGPSRAPKYRKPTSAKTLKNHRFFKVFGRPRPSKIASKDLKKLSRGYLGLLEAILSHLGAIWKTRALKRAPAGFACGAPSPKVPILEIILEPKIRLKSTFWGSFFGQFFCQLLDDFWGHFGDHFGTRSAQEGAKMSPRGQSRV